MVALIQIFIYSGTVVVFGQNSCIRGKMVLFGQSGCI